MGELVSMKSCIKQNMIDLEISKYKYNNLNKYQVEPRDWDGNPIFKKRAVIETAARHHGYAELMRRIRNSAWRRNESHNKQVAFLLNQERFQQHAGWQTEYDRLASREVAPELRPFVQARLEELKNLLLKNENTATPLHVR